jgi:hypothetical protein
VRLSCERDGEICGEAERVVWRRMDQRIELPGVLAGSALILDLRADFNLAGEFWGAATVSVPGAGGAPATLKRYELLPTTARNWDLRLEAAGVEHVLHLEMDYDFWMRSALERPRFLHRPKHLR